jgi:glycerol-3-phosphate acyltransferase PlsX
MDVDAVRPEPGVLNSNDFWRLIMADLTWIAVDAMGGDNAPAAIVEGVVQALEASKEIGVFLVGRADSISEELKKYKYDEQRLTMVPANDVISMSEAPVEAIRHKKDSSIVVGMRLIREGKARAFVSAGSTGAILVGGQLLVGRIKGIERTPIGAIIPTDDGVCLIVDSGANVDSRSSHLVQYARMGSIYMKYAVGIEAPRVALVNIGAEAEKGNALTKETYPLLQSMDDINFIGNIEAREIPEGKADVVVCDAFAGNIILKLYEGLAGVLLGRVKKGLMSSTRSKIGALLIKPALKKTLKDMDASRYGGAPLLGLKGLVVKTHGSAKAGDIRNSILQCLTFERADIAWRIEEGLKKDVRSTEDGI